MSQSGHIQFDGVSMGYKGRTILSDVNLSLEKGKIHCVFGRNGSGKTTFLKSFSGLLPIKSGSIMMEGKNLADMGFFQRSTTMALVLSESFNLPSMRVRDYISFGRYPYRNWLGTQKKEDQAIVNHSIDKCGLSELANAQVNLISDGEKQKVQLARVISQQTDLLLLDEPSSHLDLVNKAEIFHILKEIKSKQHKTIVFTSHDIQFALQLSDYFLVVENQSMVKMSKEEFVSKKVFERILKSELFKIDPDSNSVTYH